MYRLLEDFLPAQRRADTRQEHPPTKRPLKKGDRLGSPLQARGKQPSSTMFGRPVTSAGQRNATPFAGGVSVCARDSASWQGEDGGRILNPVAQRRLASG